MANFGEHLTYGVLSGFGALLIFGQGLGLDVGLDTLFFMLGLSAVGAMIPDMLEPPTGPHHRSLFHSFVVLLALIFITLEMFSMGSGLGALIGFVGVGYISHLAADSLTRSSLPLIV